MNKVPWDDEHTKGSYFDFVLQVLAISVVAGVIALVAGASGETALVVAGATALGLPVVLLCVVLIVAFVGGDDDDGPHSPEGSGPASG